MASDRQIEANRKNAEKCTGPRTEAGKEKSSQNALKTGLDAKSEVLRFESRPEYEALIAEFYARYNPTVPEDRSLVDMLILSEWLSRRYTAIDTAIWEREFYKSGDTSLGAAYLKSHDALDRVGRRINWAQRNYQFALKQLLDIRAKRTHSEAAEPEPAIHIEEQNAEPPNPEPEAPAEATETESVNPESVSFLPLTPESPKIAENIPSADPETEENPPTAA